MNRHFQVTTLILQLLPSEQFHVVKMPGEHLTWWDLLAFPKRCCSCEFQTRWQGLPRYFKVCFRHLLDYLKKNWWSNKYLSFSVPIACLYREDNAAFPPCLELALWQKAGKRYGKGIVMLDYLSAVN